MTITWLVRILPLRTSISLPALTNVSGAVACGGSPAHVMPARIKTKVRRAARFMFPPCTGFQFLVQKRHSSMPVSLQIRHRVGGRGTACRVATTRKERRLLVSGYGFRGDRWHDFPRLPHGRKLLCVVNIGQRICIQYEEIGTPSGL